MILKTLFKAVAIIAYLIIGSAFAIVPAFMCAGLIALADNALHIVALTIAGSAPTILVIVVLELLVIKWATAEDIR